MASKTTEQGLKSQYLEPLIVEPLELPHRNTFILLHGRGSTAERFSQELLKTTLDQSSETPTGAEESRTLRHLFPHAKFIFPTASKRRAAIFKRRVIHQWFDCWRLPFPSSLRRPFEGVSEFDRKWVCEGLEERQELQIEGLRETSLFLHGLLKQEIALLGGSSERVVLGGLSQGCAASLVALLLWDGPKLGAFMGMCGWLPFCGLLEREFREAVELGCLDKSMVVFDNDSGGGNSDDISKSGRRMLPASQALSQLREMLDFPGDQNFAGHGCLGTPVFLGHGILDDKVEVRLGRVAATCLEALGGHVTWKEYIGLGHWYSSEMLGEIVLFLKGPGRE